MIDIFAPLIVAAIITPSHWLIFRSKWANRIHHHRLMQWLPAAVRFGCAPCTFFWIGIFEATALVVMTGNPLFVYFPFVSAMLVKFAVDVIG